VDVEGGGDVFVGGGGVSDCVGVARKRVGDIVICSVGVSVTGAFEGRLQDVIARTRTNVNNKLGDLMVSPLLWNPLVIIIPLETYH
jgi:hypothetical protein